MGDTAQEHIDALAAQVYAARAETDALRQRIRALADKWDEIAKSVSNRGGWAHAEVREWCADDLRALLGDV